jgi:hypothetical protein
MKDYLVMAIKSLRPTSEFSFSNDDYLTIKWDVLEGVAPSKAEIETEIVKLQAAEITEAQTAALAKTALLAKLGITADEAALLLT